MPEVGSMRFRPSALFPLVTSAVAFALALVLVLSGTDPSLAPDAYLLSFNTTSLGTNLLELNAIDPAVIATPSVNSTRDVRLARSRRSIIVDPIPLSSVTSTPPDSPADDASSASASAVPESNSNSTPSAAPILAVPQTSGAPNPAIVPISVVGAVFQFMLNTFAAGTGMALEDIIVSLITTAKQENGVAPIYTMHLFGVCQANTSTTGSEVSLQTTNCSNYDSVGAVVGDFIGNTPDFVLIGATNVTFPLLSTPPGTAEAVQSFFNTVAIIGLVVFVISLITNGMSFVLSIAAFFLPYNGKIHVAGMWITFVSSQLLSLVSLVAGYFASTVTSGVNSFSDATGLSASANGNFMLLLYISSFAAQAANIYWTATWFVRFRTTSYRKRQRTVQEMQAGYRAAWKEVKSDFRLPQGESQAAEVPTNRPLEVIHWNDYKHV